MTDPDPLREDEVIEVAKVLAIYVPDVIAAEAARAAILRLDEVRGRGK